MDAIYSARRGDTLPLPNGSKPGLGEIVKDPGGGARANRFQGSGEISRGVVSGETKGGE